MSEMPRDDLYRAVYPGVEVREAPAGTGMPTLHGHFAVFNQWTEIDSMWEGTFMERIAPGAFSKTLRENREKIRVLFQHGHDPQVGDKPLGPLTAAREDDVGGAYEVPLLDTAYNRELVPGLQAGLYGSSFRFQVMKEEIVEEPKPSAHNPRGLPERTISEAKVLEFGPVTFPAYDGATAGVRSITDLFRPERVTTTVHLDGEKVAEAVTRHQASTTTEESGTITADLEALDVTEPDPSTPPPASRDQALDTDRAEEAKKFAEHYVSESKDPHSVQPSRTEAQTTNSTPGKEKNMGIEEKRARLEQIAERFKEIHVEFGADELDQPSREEWDRLTSERTSLQAAIADFEQREEQVRKLMNSNGNTEIAAPPAQPADRRDRRSTRVPTNFWDTGEYRNLSHSVDEERQAYRDGAMYAVESFSFPQEDITREEAQEQMRWLLDHDDADKTIARRILETGNPTYQRAFGKHLAGRQLTSEEQRALGLGSQGGNYPVPVTLDPTLILTSDGVVNPLRAISRVVRITGNTWNGVATDGITASYDAEFTEVGDDSPTLTQPSATVEKAQAFVPFSIEAGEDWSSLQTEMARLFRDAKDTLEAEKFLTGSGTTEPEGLLTGATVTLNTTATATFAVGDLYRLKNALPARWQAGAAFVGNEIQLDKIRQFDTGGGANLWVQLGSDTPGTVLGKPIYPYSNMSSAGTSSTPFMAYGNFDQFLIVDRVGLEIELIPHLFGTAANRPIGARGLYAYWRNTTRVLTPGAFRVLKYL